MDTNTATSILLQTPTANSVVFVKDSVTAVNRRLLIAAANSYSHIELDALGSVGVEGELTYPKPKQALLAVSAIVNVTAGLD